MNLKQLKENKVFRFLSNKYVIVLVLFLVWMGFFDDNSFFVNHRELDQEIEKLENANEYYKKQIEADQNVINNLNDPDSLEKYAREEYKMKKENEDIFIIEYDTVEED
ncbi:FtsB family cell division protein [Lutimonas sp.]|uniref:FtsB family cell division protein n=1 Tax=Lutimonas sp. TaxID=1872403 RepID=UPI003D9ABCB9